MEKDLLTNWLAIYGGTLSLSSDNLRVNSHPSSTSNTTAPAVTHYENFPVASWLCPAHLRQPIAAIYGFARAADDIADEGDASAPVRLDKLHRYRDELHAISQGARPQAHWEGIFAPLQLQLQQHRLPLPLLDALLSAFIQDIEKTRNGSFYADRASLLDYCSRSANPVGRLLLHLYGIQDSQALQQSDAICSALQLINFWQDLSEDLPRGRHYLTDADCAQWQVTRAQLLQGHVTPEIQGLIADNCAWARALMLQGAPLVYQLRGRVGWELRLVVQGGLRILDKVDALRGASLHTRRTIHKGDIPLMLWRAARM